MHFTLSSFGSALVLLSLCGTGFARAAWPRRFARDPNFSVEKRYVCYRDDILQSLEEFLFDATQFCSSYISIPLITETANTKTVVSTTTTTVETSEIPISTETTAAAATVTQTTTIADAINNIKRAPAPTPAAKLKAAARISQIIRDASADTSVALALSSACTCLGVVPSTTSVTPILSKTTTVDAEVFEYSTAVYTSTTGTTTTTATVTAPPSPSGPISGGYDSGNITSTPLLPPISANVTTPSSFSYALPSGGPVQSYNSSALSVTPYSSLSIPSLTPSPSINASFVSVTPLPPSNSSSSTSSTLPSSTAATPFVPDGCPEINNTILVAEDGERYLVQCQIDYTGPAVTAGLIEPDLQSCVEECAQANDGFSATRCLGVSYRPQLTRNCYLKYRTATPIFDPPYEVVSALLIISSNTTNTTTTSSSPGFNITTAPIGPTAISSANITSIPLSALSNYTTNTLSTPSVYPTLSLNSSIVGATATGYYSSLASITPSPSLNFTGLPSTTPSVSLNVTDGNLTYSAGRAEATST
ncbi:MAG: hypothetical protein M1830_001627, partial [Pleopsidium flavum]